MMRIGDCTRRIARQVFALALLCVAMTALPVTQARTENPVRILDDFRDLSAWDVFTSDDVKATLRQGAGRDGQALCLDFDFGNVSGYAVARRELPLTFPENYEFSFGLRGEAPANTFQFKLVDASGANVWWVNRPDIDFPRDWHDVRLKKRQIEFAWGPTADRTLRTSAALELTIVRGTGGGKGSLCFDRLSFRTLPVEDSLPPAPVVSATSTLGSHAPEHVLDGSPSTAWRSDPATGPEQNLKLDFQRQREFGGLILHWTPDAFASRYDIDLSDDGATWRTVRHVVAGNGGTDPHLLPESEARFLRVRMHDGPEKAYGIERIEVKDLSFGASPNAFSTALAAQAPRGHFPRGFAGEQSYWTVVGIDGGTAHGLLSEDGALEFGTRSASVEPFLVTDEGLVTWADVKTEQSLLDDYLPIPTVTWKRPDLVLRITAFGSGTRDHSQIIGTYSVESLSARSRVVMLALAVRPFQVNPPTQFLNTPGGATAIRDLAWDGRALSINGRRQLFPLQPPTRVGAADFDTGITPELLTAPQSALPRSVTDETGFASGIMLYRLELPPHASRTIGIVTPLAGMPSLPDGDAAAWTTAQHAAVAHAWREKLNRVRLHLPMAAKAIADTVRTALAHILISRNGAALQPGTRAYARSWVRDGAMMSDALLRLGHPDVVREYIEWFAPHQFASGKVPCCVDGRGSDPVAENDSHGEFIYLIGEYYRYTHDRAWLQSMWPRVAAAAAYMDSLRRQERSAKNETEERRAYHGLMPPSISHEGYSDQPAYSYWDNFWTLAGFESAVAIASTLGRGKEAAEIARNRDQFQRDLDASLRASMARHRIDYFPGSADRGDFDATSTTIALSIAGLQKTLPKLQLDGTFERYWQAFLKRRDSTPPDWPDYTPYELRNVGAFVRLGWRDRALDLLDFFLADRRPPGWNQWAEVVGRQVRQPRFVGDMPHGWIASDFINATLDLFAFESPRDRAVVLAAGIPLQWLDRDAVAIENLRTPYGILSYTVRHTEKRIVLTVAGGVTLPPGGLILRWPYPDEPYSARINDRPQAWNNRELRIRELPASVLIDTP